MIKVVFKFTIIIASAFSVSAQTGGPKLVDSFPRVPCGDTTGRLDSVFFEWKRNTENQIVIVYQSHRYRKNVRRKRNGVEVLVLNPAHADDGLNWAKGIPKYLLARTAAPEFEKENKLLQDRIKLVDGGYGEEIHVEIWLVPPGEKLPAPDPKLEANDLRFGASRPAPVPDHFNCYSMYN